MPMNQKEQRLLSKLQRDFPLCLRPFQRLASELGISEYEAIKKTKELKKKGFIRHLGATFDLNKLGFESILIAMRVPPLKLKRVVEIINQNHGVTHNYLRRGNYNLWFTLTAPAGKLSGAIKRLKERTGIKQMLSLPTEKVFKIDTRFKL